MYTYSQQQQQYIIEHPPLIADVASLAPLYSVFCGRHG